MAILELQLFGSVPTTSDPNTSAKLSRYKWEAYRETKIGGEYATFCQGKGIFLQSIAVEMS